MLKAVAEDMNDFDRVCQRLTEWLNLDAVRLRFFSHGYSRNSILQNAAFQNAPFKHVHQPQIT